MPKVNLTPALRAEYEKLFDTCVTRPEREAAVEAAVNDLLAKKNRYEAVGSKLGIPWAFIAVVHNMESTRNFNKHLHNGDPLTARTTLVPAGRPVKGKPPFTWEESAEDALVMKGLGAQTDWSLAGTLYQLENYNGWGYRLYHPHVLSPYLWSYSNHYSSGKYVADGTWSDTAKSAQIGGAVLLRRMAERHLFAFPDRLSRDDEAPKMVHYRTRRSDNPAEVARAVTLQTWLNTHPGIFLRLDGAPGQQTSNAFRAVTGCYLPGDPRQS